MMQQDNPASFAGGSFRLGSRAVALALLLASFASTPERSYAEERRFNPQVLALYDAYEAQLETLRAGGWPTISGTDRLQLGDESPAVVTLRQRLQASGDLAASADDEISGQFDEALLAAVQAFQARHGLAADGVVGTATLNALNVSAAQRLRQIAFNIERWDALPADFSQTFLLVNLPEYELELYQAGKPTLTMRVVIGKKSNPTPELSEQLNHFVLNPTWFVPQKIGRRELLPKIQADPQYLGKQRFDVYKGNQRLDPDDVPWTALTAGDFDYEFRQRPGPGNSLGRVKFVLPNSRNIFLHDTPQQSLFSQTTRAYSHGCVRLERPMELARALLAMDPQWTDKTVEQQLGSERTVHLRLAQPLSVYLSYLTAKVDDGKVHFFADVYGRDRDLLEQGVLPSELVAKLAQVRTFRRQQREQMVAESALLALSASDR